MQSQTPSDADNQLRNQLTYLGLVPRVHTSSLVPSPRWKALPFALRCALPPAVSPLGRAPCSVALPSLAGWSPHSRSARDHWLPGEVRARRTVRRASEYSARSRCYSGHTIGGKQKNNKGRKNNDQGMSALLSSPMYHAPRHIRVLRSPRTMYSQLTRVPRLRQNSEQFHDLGVFRHLQVLRP